MPDGTFPRPSWVLSPVFSKLEGLEKLEEKLKHSTDRFAIGTERHFCRAAAGLLVGGTSNTVANR